MPSGFAHGFMHPFGGLDHVLAMVAVGLYAAMLGGRALWLVPATFVTVMALGGALGTAGIALPYVEIGIGISVVVLGLAVALRLSLPTLGRDGAGRPVRDLPRPRARRRDAAEMSRAMPTRRASCWRRRCCTAPASRLDSRPAALAPLGGWRVAQAAGGAMALVGVAILTGVA